MKTLISEGYKIYPASKLEKKGKIYFLASKGLKKYLVTNDSQFDSLQKSIGSYNIYERTHVNALKLRKLFRHLNPVSCGVKTGFGFGDRIGLATPAHIHTMKQKNIFPVFAQQSLREMEHTGRSMTDTLDDAMWGVFQAGYKEGYGADIDHVKNEHDLIKACECPYPMYTIDPSDYVNDRVKDMSRAELTSTYRNVPDTGIYEKLYLHKTYTIGKNAYKYERRNP